MNKWLVLVSMTSSILNASYNAKTTIPINIVFKKSISLDIINRTPTLELNAGQIAKYSSVNDAILICEYTIQARDNTTLLSYTSIDALDLNRAKLSFSKDTLLLKPLYPLKPIPQA